MTGCVGPLVPDSGTAKAVQPAVEQICGRVEVAYGHDATPFDGQAGNLLCVYGQW